MTDATATPENAPAADVPTFRLFIAGRWVDVDRRPDVRVSVNPADTRDVVGRFQAGDQADVAMAVTGRRRGVRGLARDPGPEARRAPVPVRRR